MESLEQTRQAPPVGRALRILLGLALIAYVAPVYFQIPARISLRVLLLMFGLLGAYSLIHILISRRIISFGPCVGAIVAVGLLVLLCAVSWPGISILGRGQGELAAVTFLGISLVVAGLRAAPGCEVMAIPGLLFGKHTELGCIIFSPLDKLERKVAEQAPRLTPCDPGLSNCVVSARDAIGGLAP